MKDGVSKKSRRERYEVRDDVFAARVHGNGLLLYRRGGDELTSFVKGVYLIPYDVDNLRLSKIIIAVACKYNGNGLQYL